MSPLPSVHVETRATRSSHKATQTATMEEPESRPPWLAEVMTAIATCQSTPTAKIEAVQLDVSLMRQDLDRLRSRMMETEQRVGTAEDELLEHSTAIRSLQTKVKALEYRAEDAENRNRRNNLRIVGLPGGVEGPQPTTFLSSRRPVCPPNM